MYWILNYLPLLSQITKYLTLYFGYAIFNLNPVLVFIGVPIYLVFINGYYINKGKISHSSSLSHMLTVIILRILVSFCYQIMLTESSIGNLTLYFIGIYVLVPVGIIIFGWFMIKELIPPPKKTFESWDKSEDKL